jgi:hypothetical protein
MISTFVDNDPLPVDGKQRAFLLCDSTVLGLDGLIGREYDIC